ncbi:sigma-54 interaction domain-containing protein [Heyndrickxia acidicola]|uniref:Sigma-54-dependent Fis family transcriptional regulator n=1 Tax=Heyndrickxia acidicola TaxID=209389 RepID=A0ABU6MLF4_9BACI|nr:sigma-54-dependent Fis family transcriptional regulator [Heyndrickxia acidicola]MED1205222.1 sigma-54-dependent Fis family transcriptional regulator [Heyndrickxia acidicola]
MQSVLIVGGGKGGKALVKILKESTVLTIKAVLDKKETAEGILFAKELGIATGTCWQDYINDSVDIIIDVTGDEDVFREMLSATDKNTLIIPGSVAYMVARLIEEKEELIKQLQNETYKHHLILNSTDEGMIVIDKEGKVIFLNKSAERMNDVPSHEAVGRPILEIIPNSQLPRVIRTKKIESHQEVILKNGLKIIATRMPMINDKGELLGAIAVFRDITEVVELAEEITNLKEIQTMLQAIIQSSDDAISVVDEKGKGILINPAYTRITGMTQEGVIGQPATADISEGESVHLKVLQTKKPVRGVKMRLGPAKKEVIVNVAPVIVNGKLKGSVGVVHDVSEIQRLTNELDRARQIIRKLEAKYTFEDIISGSSEMNIAVEQAKLAARTPVTILLRGESGTGKELFAHAIHNASERKYNAFIRVNCAAISDSLLESELFGYEEGAFTGAKRGGKKGLFEEAHNGSIFLDEIGELNANTQAKLLRVLQENEIVRVGGTKPIPINVRIIAATHVNLEKGIADGTFREDLYYRLNRMPIYIPPLNRRKSDIPALCERLIQKINQDYGRNVEGLKASAIQKLMEYEWPGNVRELENILGRAIIFMNFSETFIDSRHLFIMTANRHGRIGIEEPHNIIENQDLASIMEKHEKKVIQQVLRHQKGNKTATARQLNISVRNLYYKLEKFNLENNSMQ